MEGQNYSLENSLQHAEIAAVMVPFPAQGHLNQLLHFSHHLTTFDIPVYYTGSSTHNRQARVRLQGWDTTNLANIHFHDFELPPHSSPPPNPDTKTTNNTDFPAHMQPIFDAFLHIQQPVCQLLQELATKYRRLVVIHDSLAASVVQDVKFILNAEAYVFVPLCAFNVFFSNWQTITDEKPFELDFDDIQTCVIPSIEGCFTPEIVEFIMNQMKFCDFQSGCVYNTNRLIEGKYIERLERLSIADGENMKHFAIGPFHPIEIRSGNDKERHVCLQWLDKQEPNSVIYVSFGSTVSLSDEQIEELAKGLEKSGQKFIWVVRYADQGDIFEPGKTGLPQLQKGMKPQ